MEKRKEEWKHDQDEEQSSSLEIQEKDFITS
jgi:hypothetical protein